MTRLTSILYVEDDVDIQSIGQMALETIGHYRVTPCNDGEEAVSAIMAGGNYQLVLLDVMMPKMDGMATFEAIRNLPSGQSIPIIFCTAKVQKTERDAYMTRGAIGIIEKPFDAMELPHQVQKLWELSRRH
jgi:two-component system, OmpR family, response regulator